MTREFVGTPRTMMRPREGRSADSRAQARLLGLGSSAGPIAFAQAEAEQRLGRLWNLCGESRHRWKRIIAGSGIESRGLIRPIEDVISMTTAQRMEAYEADAPELGTEAAMRALADSGMQPSEITDLIVVSCTGFSAPGLDVELVRRLGLRPDVRRCLIGFMGCFGGIVGLRQAGNICRAEPNATVLMVCVELCSLHLRDDTSDENLVASALFADGAAAAVVGGDDARIRVCGSEPETFSALSTGVSRLIDEGREGMTWRITDAGFAMTLSREVPVLLRQSIRSFVDEAVGDSESSRTFVIHPGGPGILEAVDQGLGLDGATGLEYSRRILREHGNMSSGTVLFVLEAALKAACRRPVMLLAFGPGLSLEGITLGG